MLFRPLCIISLYSDRAFYHKYLCITDFRKSRASAATNRSKDRLAPMANRRLQSKTGACGNWLEDEPHSLIILSHPPPPGPIHESTSTHNASKPRGRTRKGGCFPHIRRTGSQGRTGLLPAGQSLRPARPPPAHPSHWPGIEYGPGNSRCFHPLLHGG